MSEPNDILPTEEWICANCDLPLEASKIMVSYLGNAYLVDLLRCPKCGMDLIKAK